MASLTYKMSQAKNNSRRTKQVPENPMLPQQDLVSTNKTKGPGFTPHRMSFILCQQALIGGAVLFLILKLWDRDY